MEIKVELQELTYPMELDEKNLLRICGKITYMLQQEKCSVGQALEILELTKKHLVKYSNIDYSGLNCQSR